MDESAFENLLGRKPTEQEAERLYRIKETLGINDNDALWTIVLILESYDYAFRQYPPLIIGEVDRLLNEIQMVVKEQTKLEIQRNIHFFSEKSKNKPHHFTETKNFLYLLFVNTLSIALFGIAALFLFKV